MRGIPRNLPTQVWYLNDFWILDPKSDFFRLFLILSWAISESEGRSTIRLDTKPIFPYIVLSSVYVITCYVLEMKCFLNPHERTSRHMASQLYFLALLMRLMFTFYNLTNTYTKVSRITWPPPMIGRFWSWYMPKQWDDCNDISN